MPSSYAPSHVCLAQTEYDHSTRYVRRAVGAGVKLDSEIKKGKPPPSNM